MFSQSRPAASPRRRPWCGTIYTLENPERPPVVAPDWLIEALHRRAPAPVPTTSSVVPVDRHDTYTRKALQAECDTITGAPDGTQNNTINTAAFNVGTLVGAGALSEAEAREALLSAARAGNHPEGRALPTIESGLRAGSAQPRHPWPPVSRHNGFPVTPHQGERHDAANSMWAGETFRQRPEDEGSVISVRHSLGGEDDWEEPISIDRPQLTPFPTQLLGKNLAAVVEAVTAQVQVAPDITAMIALSIVSTAVGGRVQIRIRPGWSEAPSIWTATVAGAGERKSAAEVLPAVDAGPGGPPFFMTPDSFKYLLRSVVYRPSHDPAAEQ